MGGASQASVGEVLWDVQNVCKNERFSWVGKTTVWQVGQVERHPSMIDNGKDIQTVTVFDFVPRNEWWETLCSVCVFPAPQAMWLTATGLLVDDRFFHSL